jgi:hypothetical protein
MTENPFFSAFFEGFMPARQRERAALTVLRALEAKQDAFLQPGGGSADAPARTPRRTRTTSRKPSSAGGEDGDGDGTAPRYSLAASAHAGFVVETPDGRRATLAVVDCDGTVIAQDVAAEAWKSAVGAYRTFLQGTGHMKVHASAPGLAKA